MPANHANTHASCPRILVVDDQADVREALRMLLKVSGYDMVGAESPEEAMARLECDPIDAALVDMNYTRDTTSGDEGVALIARLAQRVPGIPIIAMTAWASIELAVEAMRVGAVDFIEKPWQNARVLSVLEARISLQRSRRRAQSLGRSQAMLLSDDEGFIAESSAMRQLMEDLERIAASDVAVLLLGENGTGKSAIARRIHRASPRRDQPFVKVDIGGLPPSLFEAEMFGHVRGAYTDARQDRTGRFETADGGTLFLDEIGNLPTEQQPKLLRAIEEGEFERVGASRTTHVDVRVVAATNSDLESEVQAGRFRQDLLYRLNTFQVRIPPLRERREDILPMARHYLAVACRRHRRPVPRMTSDVQRVLLDYPWPGNVRELSHAMERAALLGIGADLDIGDLRLSPELPRPAFGQMRLDEAEALLLRGALLRHPENLQRAADELGISRQSLYRRMEKYGLRTDEGDAG